MPVTTNDISINVFYRTEYPTDISYTLNDSSLVDLSFVTITVPAYGDVSLNVLNGEFTYTYNDTTTLTTDYFEYNIYDISFDISVNGRVDCSVIPIIVNDIDVSMNHKEIGIIDSSLNIDASTNNTTNNYINASFIVVNDASYGNVSISGNTFTYIHTGTTLADDTFSYKIQNGSVESNEAIVGISFNMVNYSPNMSVLFNTPLYLNQTSKNTFVLKDNELDDTVIKYMLLNIDGNYDITLLTQKGILSIENPITIDTDATISYKATAIGADQNEIYAFRFKNIDEANSTTTDASYIDVSDNGNMLTILFIINNIDPNPYDIQYYYNNFKSYNVDRVSDRRYKEAYEYHKKFLYVCGYDASANLLKDEYILLGLYAVRGALKAYKYNQPAKALYQELVQLGIEHRNDGNEFSIKIDALLKTI